MYDKRGKNYCVDTVWGNWELGKYSGNIVQVILNTHVHIFFIPRYHSDEFPFPPPLDWYKAKWKNSRNTIEARIHYFRYASIVFYEYGETLEKPVLVKAGDTNIHDEFVEHEKLVFCLNSGDFEKWTKMLRDSEKEILQRKAEKMIMGPYFPRYEDISDIEVYRFIHEKLAECKALLSPFIVQRLEL